MLNRNYIFKLKQLINLYYNNEKYKKYLYELYYIQIKYIIDNYIQLFQNKVILDFGGTGIQLLTIIDSLDALVIYNTDKQLDKIQKIYKRLNIFNEKVIFLNDIFCDYTYDYVIAFHVLEHLQYPDRYISLLTNLSDNIIVDVPFFVNNQNAYYLSDIDMSHFSPFSFHIWIDYFLCNNFECIKMDIFDIDNSSLYSKDIFFHFTNSNLIEQIKIS